MVDDQIDIELLEEKNSDSENELEEELKFHSSVLEAEQISSKLNTYGCSNMFKLNVWQGNGVTTPPPQLL
jgi:hypothetical protein